jgi:hypothetical protein
LLLFLAVVVNVSTLQVSLGTVVVAVTNIVSSAAVVVVVSVAVVDDIVVKKGVNVWTIITNCCFNLNIYNHA